MSNLFKIPFVNPFKFIPSVINPGVHFDDDWACMQNLSFERRLYYKQKWVRSEKTKIQMESTVAPANLIVADLTGATKKTIPWTAIFSSIYYSVYETTFDVSDLPAGTYVLYQVITGNNVSWQAISEPIDCQDAWPGTLLITYRNSFNDFDIAFSSGIQFSFRVECAVHEFEAGRESTEYIDQTRNVTRLRGVPYRTFRFSVGDARGVPPYIIDILNRIFECDSISIQGKFFQADKGARWETQRIRGYNFIGSSIMVVEAFNKYSLEFNDSNVNAPGLVAGYNIDTSFFGPGSLVPVTDIQKQQ